MSMMWGSPLPTRLHKKDSFGDLQKPEKGRKGITGLQTREEDFVTDIFVTSTHQRLLFFTSCSKVYELKAYEIPEAGRQARVQPSLICCN